MPYYIFKCATNTIETGPIFPQIQKMSSGYDYNADNSVYALSRKVLDFPDFTPNLDYFVVHNKAKLTDVLSNAILTTTGFLVSEKLKTILAHFKLMSHQVYKTKVLHKKNFYNYYWLHFKPDLITAIDFNKSSFVILLNYAHKLENIDISSIEDYHKKKEKIIKDNPGKTVSIWANKISLRANFNRKLDFFKIGTFDSNYYISEKLKSAMLTEQITGCDITFADNLLV